MARNRLSQFEAFVESQSEHPVFIGIDVHKKSYAVGLVRADRSPVSAVFPAKPEKVLRLIERLEAPLGVVAYEAGPTGFVLARCIEAAGYPLIVVAPSRVPRPVTRNSKTDRLDCLKLADFASKGFLRPIAVPTEEEESNRSLGRRQIQLTESIRRVKQRIRSLLLEYGFEEPVNMGGWSKRVLAELKETPAPAGTRQTLDSHLRELNWLLDEQKQVQKHLAGLLHQNGFAERINFLETVPGVSTKVATMFILEIFNPQRFQNAEKLTSYIGLAPVVSHSGDGKARSRLRPAGKEDLRSIIIQAAWIFKRYDEEADALYKRLLSRHGLPQKAIVAVARKLSIILWRLLVEVRAYESRPLKKAA